MNLIKIHRKYLFNKINLIISSIVLIICLLTCFINLNTIKNYNNWFYQKNSIDEYIGNNLMIFKLIVVSFICFLFGNSFSIEMDNYHQLYNNFFRRKLKFFITKVLLLSIISFIIVFSLYLIINVLGIIESNYYTVNKSVLSLFFNLFIIILIYGFLSVIFSLLVPSSTSYFIAIGLFVFGEIIKDDFEDNLFVKSYEILFPSLVNQSIGSNYNPYGMFHLLFILLVYFLISLIVYIFHYRD